MIKHFAYLFVISLIATEADAQIDTLQVLNHIRNEYQIIQSQLSKLQKDTIDMFHQPSIDEQKESQTGGEHKFVVFKNSKDTLLIQEFRNADEGGPYTLSVTEVYFSNHEPFFYYNKEFLSWTGILSETRMYLFQGKILKKLTKEIEIRGNEIPDYNLLVISSPSVPNVDSRIDRYDYNQVIDIKNRLLKRN